MSPHPLPLGSPKQHPCSEVPQLSSLQFFVSSSFFLYSEVKFSYFSENQCSSLGHAVGPRLHPLPWQEDLWGPPGVTSCSQRVKEAISHWTPPRRRVRTHWKSLDCRGSGKFLAGRRWQLKTWGGGRMRKIQGQQGTEAGVREKGCGRDSEMPQSRHRERGWRDQWCGSQGWNTAVILGEW